MMMRALVVVALFFIVFPTSCTSFTVVQNTNSRNTNLYHNPLLHYAVKARTRSSWTRTRTRTISRGNNRHQCFMSTVSRTSTDTESGTGTGSLSELRPQFEQKPQTMKFIATKRVETEPISIPKYMVDMNMNMNMESCERETTKTKSLTALLNEFFSNDSNRNLLFPSNNAESLNNVGEYDYEEEQLISQEFVEKWATEAKLGGGKGPTVVQIGTSKDGGNQPLYKLVNEESVDGGAHFEKQSIFKIDALLQMPGLQIISESTIGMKLLLPSHVPPPTTTPENQKAGLQNDNEVIIFPEYQFTLLESNLKPKGRAPVVWLFNKLTKFRDSTSSFTKVSVEKVTNNQEQEQQEQQQQQIVFVTDAKMETRMHLPSKLLKVLPNVNIAKFESQGSASVQRLLEKELGPALNGFGRAFRAVINEEIEEKEKNVKRRTTQSVYQD